jgi:hypothetical protein
VTIYTITLFYYKILMTEEYGKRLAQDDLLG